MKNYVDKDKLQEFATKLHTKQKTIFATKAEVGTPLTAATVADMTDETKVYVYTGSESGYTAGNWYYYDGEDWISGGVYNAVAIETDKTLSLEDFPADALYTGIAISDINNDLNDEIDRATMAENSLSNRTTSLENRTTSLENRTTSLETDVETLNQGGLIIDNQVVANNVQSWLDEHPEATTTVQDDSLTQAKFTDELKLKTLKDYVTPEMYGAIGDGETDDTQAIQSALNSGNAVIFAYNKIYRAEGLVAPINSIIDGNGATIQSLTTNNTILTISRDSIIENITLSGIDGIHLASSGLVFASNSGYRIKLDNIKVQNCDYGVTDTNGIWSVDIGKIWIKSCEKGFHIKHTGGSTSLSISNFLHENCGAPLYLRNMNYSYIGTLYGDYANGGEETSWAYGTGHGLRSDSVYKFLGCKGLFINSIGGENNVGKYFVDIGSSDITFGSAYIVRQKSYEESNRCLFHVSAEISRVNIGAVQYYPNNSDSLTLYDDYYDFNYNLTYGEPNSYLLKVVTGTVSARTNKQIIAPNNPQKPIDGYFSINNAHQVGSIGYFNLEYTKSSNYYLPIHQKITIVMTDNNTQIRIVKGEIIGLVQTNSILVGSAAFSSYTPSTADTPTQLTVTKTTGKYQVTLPENMKQAWVTVENYCPLTNYTFSFEAVQ